MTSHDFIIDLLSYEAFICQGIGTGKNAVGVRVCVCGGGYVVLK